MDMWQLQFKGSNTSHPVLLLYYLIQFIFILNLHYMFPKESWFQCSGFKWLMFPYHWASPQVSKDKRHEKVSGELLGRSNMTVLWEWGLLGATSSDWLAAGFCFDCRTSGFQRAGERVRGVGKVLMPHLCSSWELAIFFLSKCSPDCLNPLVNFQSSKETDFDNFCQCSPCFYGGMDFRKSHFIIPAGVLPVLHFE